MTKQRLFSGVPVRATAAGMVTMMVVPTLLSAHTVSAATSGATAITAGHAVHVSAGDYILTVSGLAVSGKAASSPASGEIVQQVGGSGPNLRTADAQATSVGSTVTADVRVAGSNDVFNITIPNASWSSMTLTPATLGYVVRGNSITSPTSARVTWHGVNAVGDMHTSDFDAMAAHYPAIKIARLMIDERCWDPFFTSLRGRKDCADPAAYQAKVVADVARITSNGEVALVAPVDAGRDGAAWSPQGQADDFGPDQRTLAMWDQFVQLWGSNPNVVFETYNEPKMSDWKTYAPNTTSGPALWLNGGTVTIGSTTWSVPGAQQIVDQIRNDGANNLILVEGLSWGGSVLPVEKTPVLGTNLAYSFHAYRDPDNVGAYPPGLDSNVAPVIDPSGPYAYAAMMSEFGTTQNDFGGFSNGSNYEASTIEWAQSHGVGWVAWGWYPGSWNKMGLLNSYSGPTPNLKGQAVLSRL